MPHFSPEVRRLILYFAACDGQKPIPRAVADWDQTLEAIFRHRIIGPTYYTLSQQDQPDFPPLAFQRTIKLLHYKNVLETAKKVQAIKAIVNRLEKDDIDFMVVKGPVLANTIYPVAAIRYFRDLDLILKEQEKHLVDSALSDIGYNIKEGDIGYLPPLTPNVMGLRHTQYYHPQVNFLVEAHWENFLVDDLVLRDMDSIWRRAIDVNIDGVMVKAPSLEDHMMHLCAHVHSHRFKKLFWLTDLLCIVRDHGDKIDWDRFLKTVVLEEIEVPVYYSFKLLDFLFDQSVPVEVMDAIRPDRFRRWFHERFISEEESQLLAGEDLPPISFQSTPLFESTMQNLLVMSRRTDKIKFLFRLLFPSPQWLQHRYNLAASQSVLPYYFKRLIQSK